MQKKRARFLIVAVVIGNYASTVSNREAKRAEKRRVLSTNKAA